jgi:hypothetical protein
VIWVWRAGARGEGGTFEGAWRRKRRERERDVVSSRRKTHHLGKPVGTGGAGAGGSSPPLPPPPATDIIRSTTRAMARALGTNFWRELGEGEGWGERGSFLFGVMCARAGEEM